jgi:propionaldehyde dehydrogenase
VILREAGITAPSSTKIAFFETDPSHPLVEHEQLMPIIPLIRARNFSQAVEISCEAEHGFGHTAIIHSTNMQRVTEFARAIRCTVFVVNAPSYAWAGKEGEGRTTLTIAGPNSGEGLTSPRTFTRRHYIVVSGALNAFA